MLKKASTDILSLTQLIVATAKTAHPNCKPQHYHRVLRFIYRVFCKKNLLTTLINRVNNIAAPHAIPVDTDHVGAMVWPYVCNEWNEKKRCDVIASHYEYLADNHYYVLMQAKQQPITLIDLSDHSANTRIVIDKPIWFRREGELVINLFQGELRVVSIAVVINKEDMIIGAVQGIHGGVSTDESLAIFKNLTKDFNGLRPRSLVLEVLRNLATHMSMHNILAVADKNRHHRHTYFGKSSTSELSGNYDTVWEENGGWQEKDGDDYFYQLPIRSPRKPIEEIASKKRSLYRRRYAMLDTIANDVNLSMDKLKKNT
ncbi:DUF535 family protein [Eionea flava]